jgi:hypothetical protein
MNYYSCVPELHPVATSEQTFATVEERVRGCKMIVTEYLHRPEGQPLAKLALLRRFPRHLPW